MSARRRVSSRAVLPASSPGPCPARSRPDRRPYRSLDRVTDAGTELSAQDTAASHVATASNVQRLASAPAAGERRPGATRSGSLRGRVPDQAGIWYPAPGQLWWRHMQLVCHGHDAVDGLGQTQCSWDLFLLASLTTPSCAVTRMAAGPPGGCRSTPLTLLLRSQRPSAGTF